MSDVVENGTNGAERDNAHKHTDSARRMYRTTFWRILRNVRNRFDLGEDGATQEEVVANITKSVEFRGTNIWVLICATFVASLGLNVNSTAVIIGAMLISPLMGPIMGTGLSLGINDFQLFKKSLRNFLWMFAVSAVTSTVYFLVSPYSNAQSELLARTSPTSYDVLIAFFGGFAGMLAQTRKDRTGTVVSGVAIATALMPPLCTVGFGIANGEIRYILGALYLFLINAVFIAVASYLVVLLLKYEKATVLDKASSKRMKRYMILFAVIVIVPSTIMTFNILRRTQFESNVNRYVSSVFQFNKTMLVDYEMRYHYDGKKSAVEVRLVGEPLNQNVIDNASAQMAMYGLDNTDLIVRQADETDRIDLSTIQRSYSDIIDEKNNTIARLEERLSRLQTVDTIAVSDISREISYVAGNIGDISLTKNIYFDTSGNPQDTVVTAVIRPAEPSEAIDRQVITDWLRTRLKAGKVTVIVGE